MCEGKLPLEEGITLNWEVFFSQISPQRGLMIKGHLPSAFSTAEGHSPSILKSDPGGVSEHPPSGII